MNWRKKLLGSRQDLDQYRESLAALPDTLVNTNGRIGKISIAPIKGLGMLNLGEVRIKPYGLATVDDRLFDRSMMIVVRKPAHDTDDRYTHVRFSQRDCKKMCLAMPSYQDGVLEYRAPGMQNLKIEPLGIQSHSLLTACMYKQDGEAVLVTGLLECGAITEWMREFLVRSGVEIDPDRINVLVASGDVERRVVQKHACGTNAQTLFADAGQLLVTSTETTQWMNRCIRTDDKEARFVCDNAFRPNILLTGFPANAEDLVSEVRVGEHDIRVYFGGLCKRCIVTCIDPPAGNLPDAQPLMWLVYHRPAVPEEDSKPTFGVNCVFRSQDTGKIMKQGDSFAVIAEK